MGRSEAESAPIPILDRVRFHDLWDDLPAVTVLAALPGWGRSEWMRACAARLLARGRAGLVLWPPDRRAASAALEVDAAERAVIFLDDVVAEADDTLWDTIAGAAARGVRVVVSTVDAPAGQRAARVLDERELRFSREEISELVVSAGVPLLADVQVQLDEELLGVPLLVTGQLRRLRRRHREEVWAGLAFGFERTLLEHLAARAPDIGDSSFAQMLRSAACYRRFSPQLLGAVDDDARRAHTALFNRLEALPLGVFDIDDETGQRDFVWSATTWRALDDLLPADERRRGAEIALLRTGEDSRVTQRLYYLLQLGRLDEADSLVFDQHRRFLLFTNAETQDALLAAASSLEGRPSLLLLAAELRLRTKGANPQTMRDAAACLENFSPPPEADALLRFRLSCRRAMAAAYAGRRALGRRHLVRVMGMLDDTDDPRLRRQADTDPAVAQRVAADLYLAFWAAIQTDEHEFALELSAVMTEYGDPDDMVSQIDRLTAMTEQDFAGLRSRDPDARRPEHLEYSHAASLVFIEEGDDRAALEVARSLSPRVRPAPTRSAADALLLLSHALVAPGRPERSIIEATVALSRSFWDDGRPSAFVGFAAVVAHLAAGRVADARAVIAQTPGTNWFVDTARALVELNAGDPRAALPLVEAAEASTGLPRLVVASAMIGAAAFACAGMPEAAAAKLAAAWHAEPAPRLVRFGLRLLPDDVLTELTTAARGSAPEAVLAVLATASGDARPARRHAHPIVSPVERELLALLRRGLSNAAIADARGVSPNTVRTQLRLLYRKLGVSGRSEAIAAAEGAQVLDETD